jgi:hypothetical protein
LSRLTQKTISLVQAIYWITLLNLAAGFFLGTISATSGDGRWIRYFFDIQSPLFFVGFSGLGVYFSVVAWWQFGTGEPMRWAWFLITVASCCRFVGLIIIHAFGTSPSWSHGFYASPPFKSLDALALRQLGLGVCGPVHMLVLSFGLLLVLGTYRKFGLLARFNMIDHSLLCFVGVYTFCRLFEWSQWLVKSGGVVSFYDTAAWVTDPLLCVLLFEAVLIRRAVVNMGRGLVAKCWGGFTAAILFTSLGNMGTWATAQGYLPQSMVPLFWAIWCLATAAYVLGPAYQVEAALRAREQRRVPLAA